MRGKNIFKIAICILFISGCAKTEQTTEGSITRYKPDRISNISFLAVGDNLIHEAIYTYNYRQHGDYNLNHIYDNTNYLTQNADLAYINLETLASGKELGLSGYPTFNGPYEVLDGVVAAGFDWLSAASNHSFDRGVKGIINQKNYFDKYTDAKMTGMSRNQDEADQLNVFDIKDVKIGVQSYTYGLNGFELPQDAQYLINVIDKDRIAEDMERLQAVTDLQIVSMHWGQEYQFSPNEEQIDLAQFLSDLGVDVIIGAHPHVIQPMDYLFGKEGNKTLVMYSLGNFLSAQDENYRMLGGMAKFEINYNRTKSEFEFVNVAFLPTITHITDNFYNYSTYVLKDYTNELASNHTLAKKGQNVTREYFIELVNEVMNDNIEIIY